MKTKNTYYDIYISTFRKVWYIEYFIRTTKYLSGIDGKY